MNPQPRPEVHPPGWAYQPRHAPPPSDLAACTPTDADRILFPEGAGTKAYADLAEARQLCQSCEARDACLNYALTADERFGIWGGLTPPERAEIRERLGLPAIVRRPGGAPFSEGASGGKCGTRSGYHRHLKRGTDPCRSCREANTAYHARRRERGAA